MLFSLLCYSPQNILRRSFTSQLHSKQIFSAIPSFRMASSLPRLPIFEAIARHDPKSTVAVHSASGRRFTYGQLLGDVADRKEKLIQESGKSGIHGERIAFLVENSYDYIGAHNGTLCAKKEDIDCVISDLSKYPWYAFNCIASVAGISSTWATVYFGSEWSLYATVLRQVWE